MDLNYLILDNLWIMKHEGKIIKNNIISPSMIWTKGIALRIARRRMLELLWKESQWTLGEGIISLMNHHVAPWWRTPVNKRMTKRKGSWKHKVKPCNDLDETLRWDKVETWNSRKERRALETKNLNIVNKLRKTRLTYGWNKNKNYIMLNLHQ